MNFGHLWNIYDVTIKTEYLKTKVLIAKKKKKWYQLNLLMLPYLHIWLFILLIKKISKILSGKCWYLQIQCTRWYHHFCHGTSWQLYHISKTAKQHLNFMMMVMVIFNVISHIKFHLQSDIMYINSNSHKLKVHCKFIIHFDTASVVLSFMCSPQVWQIMGKSLTHIFYGLESYSFHTCWMARNHVNLIIRVNMCF